MNKFIIKYSLAIILIDIILIWIYVYIIEKPDPSISIASIIIIPALVIMNILGGLVLRIFKFEFGKILLINSILSPLIFLAIWAIWYNNYSSKYYIDYQFYSNNKLHELSLTKDSNSFYISDISTQEHGFTTGILYGEYERKNDTILLKSDTIQMYIYKSQLFYFPKDSVDIINLKRQ